MAQNWYKLDNAAKIFPAVRADDGSNYYRLCAVLKEEVKVEYLAEALKTALERFPTFCVRLRTGIFWYYFEHNDAKPLIRQENPILFDSTNTDEHNRFMFTLEYFGKRISLEVFHALSDGTGSCEFFKTILYYYLNLTGADVANDGSILTSEYEQLIDEAQDSFAYNYDKDAKRIDKESKAYKLPGTPYAKQWVSVIHTKCAVEELKALAKPYGATITEYLSAVLLYVCYQGYHDKKHRPIQLFTPVNARKMFASKTLRNFVLYIRTGLDMQDENVSYSFDNIIEIVKSSHKKDISKEELQARLVSNVRLEKIFFVRILPLFIKNIVMKLSYNRYGSDLNTVSFSNLGVIKVPKSFHNYIDEIYFMIGVSDKGPLNLSASSYNDRLTITFTSRIIERNVQKEFIRFLANQGLSMVVTTNELEVE